MVAFVFVSVRHGPIIRIGRAALLPAQFTLTKNLASHMTRLCLALLLSSCIPTMALANQTSPDPAIASQLKQLAYKYSVDEDGDYKLLMGIGDSDRSQIVFVRSPVEQYGKHRIREIWSYAYQAAGEALPEEVANRLLEASADLILGSWVKNGNYAVYVAKIPANASLEALGDAIDAAANTADEMEIQLASDASSDDY